MEHHARHLSMSHPISSASAPQTRQHLCPRLVRMLSNNRHANSRFKVHIILPLLWPWVLPSHPQHTPAPPTIPLCQLLTARCRNAVLTYLRVISTTLFLLCAYISLAQAQIAPLPRSPGLHVLSPIPVVHVCQATSRPTIEFGSNCLTGTTNVSMDSRSLCDARP